MSLKSHWKNLRGFFGGRDEAPQAETSAAEASRSSRARVFEPNGDVRDGRKTMLSIPEMPNEPPLVFDDFGLPDDTIDDGDRHKELLAGEDFSFDEGPAEDIDLMRPESGATDMTRSAQRRVLMKVMELEAER